MTDVPETRWARTIDGACIAYQDLGPGPVTLLVVHGWVSHLEVYWELEDRGEHELKGVPDRWHLHALAGSITR